jgi:4-diphosphocytidyl-2-C-methyl-D-erythritol kinase
MPEDVTIAAHAKVNLHLDVGSLRPDGFHEIISLFQAVSLSDRLRLRATGFEEEVIVSGDFGFPAEQNIITKAVRLFREETGIRTGVRVDVEKRIPVAAGFGGGSSDAAAVLRGLVALLESPVPKDRLLALAGELGSDVPFFLLSPAALVEGRGERVTPIVPRLDFCLVALMPGVPVSTAEAYRALDAHGAPPGNRLSAAEVRSIYEKAPVASWRFVNSFDVLAERLSPKIAVARDALYSEGALAARFTGSGSTVIGLFDDTALADACVARLNGCGLAASMLLPLALIPAVC